MSTRATWAVVEIITAAFAGQSRITRRRMVYEVLAAEPAAGVHALQLATLAPEEMARRPGRASGASVPPEG